MRGYNININSSFLWRYFNRIHCSLQWRRSGPESEGRGLKNGQESKGASLRSGPEGGGQA
jgi:hypothetical protein